MSSLLHQKDESMNLNNKVAIITGASSGIGRGIAIKFSQLGASLIITGRNETGLDETISKCDVESRARIVKVVGDLADDETLKLMPEEAIKHFGKLDILVNNAASGSIKSFEDSTIEDFDETFNINLKVVYKLMKLCLPHLIETKGNIVNISSCAAEVTFKNVSIIGASKAALDHLSRAAAYELGIKGVRVNTVNPGAVITAAFERSGVPDVDKYLDQIAKCTPLKRVGNTEEVANAVAFIASDLSSFITGESLFVDGGLKVRSPLE